MQVANCYLVLGKLSLMQNIMNVYRAVKFLEEALRIKQILLKKKQRSSEISSIKLLLKGTKSIQAKMELGEGDSAFLSDGQQEIKDLEALLKQELEESMIKADMPMELQSETKSQKEEALEVQKMIDEHQHQTKTLDSLQTQDEESELMEAESSDMDAEMAFTMQMIK